MVDNTDPDSPSARLWLRGFCVRLTEASAERENNGRKGEKEMMHSLRFRVMCGAALLRLLDLFAAEAQEAASVNPSAGPAASVSNYRQSAQMGHWLEAIVVVGADIEAVS